VASGTVRANGIELWFETMGDDDGAPLLLIGGLGAQAINWHDEFCWGLADRGFRVVRFDNRDSGLSAFIEEPVDLHAAATSYLAGEPVAAPYRLSDMAADAVGLLDALEIDAAHVLGSSLGGMVAQTMAIEHRGRVRSLTSLMSSTGEREYLLPEADVLGLLLEPVGERLEDAEAAARRWSELVGSPDHRDEELAVEMARRAWERSPRRDGTVRQLAALVASPSRAEALAALDLPALVAHGTADRLLRPEGGRRTAELIPGAQLLELEGMGHDLPVFFWAPIIEQVTGLAVRS